MFFLSLKDSRQLPLVNGTLISVTGDLLVIINGNFEKKIRLPYNNFTSGNYWIDSTSKLMLVELCLNGQFVSMFNVSLGSEFDQIFPNAGNNWGAYFFKLHYSFWEKS